MNTIKLSIMMFLQYFVWGAWYVTLGSYLLFTKDENGVRIFTDQFVGSVYGNSAIAAMIAPFFIGLIADRFFAAEKILFALHFLGAALLYATSLTTNSTLFWLGILGHLLCYMPTIAMSNAITMQNVPDPQKQFPQIRVLGTIGWIVAGLLIGALVVSQGQLSFSSLAPEGASSIEPTAIPLKIAAGSQILLAIFCLFLPHTPPAMQGQTTTLRDILGLDAIAIMKSPSVFVFVLSSMLICIPLQFYYTLTNGYLNEIGIENAASKMTLGQMSEIFFMLILPATLTLLGIRWIMIVGMTAWVVRYLMFAYGNSTDLVWLIYAGILLHGICYDFFFVTGQIYIDSKAPPRLRSAVQGLLTFLTYGIGMYLGSILSGWALDRYAIPETDNLHNWTNIWLIPAGLALAITIMFVALFRDDRPAIDTNVVLVEPEPIT